MEVIDFTIRKICKTAADSQLQRDLQANLLQFRSTHHGGFLTKCAYANRPLLLFTLISKPPDQMSV
jgi:hypothetical protein